MDSKYIAGFFDGEGSICLTGKNKNRWTISIPQTNFEVLESIYKFLGYGRVIKVTKRKVHWKDAWVYQIGKQEEVFNFLKLIYPNLIVKRDKVYKALKGLIKIIDYKKLIENKRIKVKELVSKGLSYRKIEKEYKINRGFIYRTMVGCSASLLAEQ